MSLLYCIQSPASALRVGLIQALGVGMQLSRTFNIFADYFQFVLMDEGCEDDFGSVWTEEALERMLATGETSVCPGTLRNVLVPVEIHIHETEPSIDLAGYDSFSTRSARCGSA